MKWRFLLVTILSATTFFPALAAAEKDEKETYLGEIVVTAPATTKPLAVETDPKTPRQPIPPADGGGYLKNIPGISVTRKGGTSGDPLLRGMGGSRLNILLDGEYLLGGCGGRMDAPTAYIFPESYDKITVLKGPQTVIYGGGNVAGTVLFERKTKRFETPGARGLLSATYGSFDRNDQMIDITGGTPNVFMRVIGTRSDSNDYQDGDGHRIHSFYTRESLTGILGITPDDDTRLELTADFSQAEAAYADRTMDGPVFDREGYNLKMEKRNISSFLNAVEILAYYNYIDHVMDNFSLRTPTGMPMLNNPDRETKGYRVTTDWELTQNAILTAGFDFENDERTSRSGVDYNAQVRVPDMNFKRTGIFGELNYEIARQDRVIGGLRADFLNVKNQKPGSEAEDQDTLRAAFLRYEHDCADAVTTYIGIGRAERAPDWWERNKLFYLDNETNVQTDVGVIYNKDKFRSALSVFYANIEDYILISSAAPTARNIDAKTYGTEAEFSYSLLENWNASAAMAYVWGANKTDNTPLPQTPPFSATLGLRYDNQTYLAGILYRVVDKQDRVDVGKGNIIGTDIAETPGFSTLSVNAGYRPTNNLLITAGVDNIFDKNYAEHISKAGSSSVTAFGLTQTARVNEPGRTVWIKASYSF
ncbi:MAG: TonB-dependent copper receptor [Candidatus Schekmanbacteria bacterium]|nr:TonB-dependent copper receptor [Candidatus Schekmanbacteria bacterium]